MGVRDALSQPVWFWATAASQERAIPTGAIQAAKKISPGRIPIRADNPIHSPMRVAPVIVGIVVMS